MNKSDHAALHIIGLLIALVLKVFILMLAWNFVMPYLFHLPQINWQHSLALVAITGIILRTTIKCEHDED